MGQFDSPGLGEMRSGKCALFIPEKLAFKKRTGNRGAVDLDERSAGIRRKIVDKTSQQPFPSAIVALDEDRDSGLGDFVDFLLGGLHKGSAAKNQADRR